ASEPQGAAAARGGRGGRAGGDRGAFPLLPQPRDDGRRTGGRTHHADGVESVRARGASTGGRQPGGESGTSAGKDRCARFPGGRGSSQSVVGVGGERSAFRWSGRAAHTGKRGERE